MGGMLNVCLLYFANQFFWFAQSFLVCDNPYLVILMRYMLTSVQINDIDSCDTLLNSYPHTFTPHRLQAGFSDRHSTGEDPYGQVMLVSTNVLTHYGDKSF